MRFCDGCGSAQFQQRDQITEIIERIERLIAPVWGRFRVGSDIVLMAVLFVATALTIFPFFTGEFTQNWGSIESAYIADSIFIVNNFPNLGWYPFWYGGLPFHLSYPPLFIWLVAVIHLMLGVPIGHAYRILGGLAYSTIPLTLYLLAKYLTKSGVAAFFAGITYALVPTFLPTAAPSHVAILVVYGEAPHMLGFSLGLLALVQLLRCMNRPTWPSCLAASILMASVALVNLVALFALAFFLLVAVTTEVLYRTRRAMWTFIFSALLAYGLVAFQYDLGFIIASAQFSTQTGAELTYSILLFPALMLGLGIARRFVSKPLSNRPAIKPVFFALLWILLFFVIVAGRWNWFNIPTLAPQPHRYVPEFDAGVSLLIGMLVMSADKLVSGSTTKLRLAFGKALRIPTLGLILMILLISSILALPYSLTITQPTTQVSVVPEYRIANWLSDHVTDESVFATGSVQFWLNVFSNVRQVKGGSDQGATNTWYDSISYQILTGSDPQISILWAQAWNVKYIVVAFPNASTPYHDYSYPHKFDGVLPLRYYYQGHGVFEVALPRPSLFEAISAQGSLTLSTITGVLDTRDVSAYVNLTQIQPGPNGVQVTYTTVNSDLIQVSVANATPDTAILVKMTYDPQWRAECKGASIGVSQFGPDFMITYPQSQGNYQITFRFERSAGETLGLYLTTTTLVAIVLVSVFEFRRKLRKRPSVSRRSTLAKARGNSVGKDGKY